MLPRSLHEHKQLENYLGGEADRRRSGREHLDVLEMGVLEMSGILEAKAKEAIEANVRRPDQSEWKELWFGGEKANCEQNDGG